MNILPSTIGSHHFQVLLSHIRELRCMLIDWAGFNVSTNTV